MSTPVSFYRVFLFMTLHLVSSAASATTQDSRSETDSAVIQMSADIATSRIQQAIATPENPELQRKLLLETIDRCKDEHLVSIAQYNFGTLTLHSYVALIADSEEATSELANTQFEQSSLSFKYADLHSTDITLRTQARSNLGRLYYEQAHALYPIDLLQEITEPEQIIFKLKSLEIGLLQSASMYRSIQELTQENLDSAKDVQRIRIEIQQVRDQIHAIEKAIEQAEQDQQERQKQQQEAADELNELADEQEEQSERSKGEQSSLSSDELKDNQDKLSDKTKETKEAIDEQQSSESDQMKEIQELIEQAMESQEKAEQALEEQDMQKASEEQQKASDQLRQAAQAMQSMADESKNSENDTDSQENQSGDESNKDSESQSDQEDNQEGEQINEIAKELLDKERRERETRQVYRAKGKPTKVENDW